MKRIASVSLVVVALGGLAGCEAPVESSGGAAESTTATAAATPIKPVDAIRSFGTTPAVPEAGGLHPDAILLPTNWVALPNDWGQTYGIGTGGFADYSFSFPTPWITWIGTAGQTNPEVDFDAFFYERDELMPIVSSNSAPAYDNYQWWVAQVTLETCTVTGVVDPRSGPGPTGVCIKSVNSSLRFLVPFTDTSQETALGTAEASWLGQESDVQAAITIRPAIYKLLLDDRGGAISGTGASGATYLVSPAPVVTYPYADVHDPKQPPI
jgi:hypothetical protein